MQTSTLLALATAVMLWVIFAGRLRNVPVTGPLVMTSLGLITALVVSGSSGHVQSEHESTESLASYIHLIAEITLVVVLFSDASRIKFTALARDHVLPRRLLLIALPLVIVFGVVAAWLIFPELGIAGALLLAAILAPTDAALGQSVVSNPSVPEHIRVGIEVESGLNDGIALVAVLFALCLLGWTHEIDSTGGWLLFGLQQIGVGAIVGVVVGWLGARVIHWADTSAGLDASMRVVAGLALAGIGWAAAEQVSGNGFISAFVAGLVFGRQSQVGHWELSEFMETEGQLLVLTTFFLFGFGLLPDALLALNWHSVLYACLSLTIVRTAAVAIGTIKLGYDRSSIAFVGWFGPRGLASVLFSLLAVDAISGSQKLLIHEVANIAYITIALSILLHGLTATPLANLYSRLQNPPSITK